MSSSLTQGTPIVNPLEFSYRWNERKTTDEARTVKALNLIEGKRLMYKEPIRRA